MQNRRLGVICFPILCLASASIVLNGVGHAISDGGEHVSHGAFHWIGLVHFSAGFLLMWRLYTINPFRPYAPTRKNVGSGIWVAWVAAILTWVVAILVQHKLVGDVLQWNTAPPWFDVGHFIFGMFVPVFAGWWILRDRQSSKVTNGR